MYSAVVKCPQEWSRCLFILHFSFYCCICPLGFFVLNNQSGILSLCRQLDFETAVQYVLNISASDLGEPPRQTFTNITVHVIDVNDNSPMFQPRSLRVSLVEVRSFIWLPLIIVVGFVFLAYVKLAKCKIYKLKPIKLQ